MNVFVIGECPRRLRMRLVRAPHPSSTRSGAACARPWLLARARHVLITCSPFEGSADLEALTGGEDRRGNPRSAEAKGRGPDFPASIDC